MLCDKIISALKLYPEFKEAKNTIYFLNAVLEFWKMINVRSKITDPQIKDNLRIVITSSFDIIVWKLKNFNFMIQNMCSSGGKRTKSLTKDTVSLLSRTCSGLVEISEYLL